MNIKTKVYLFIGLYTCLLVGAAAISLSTSATAAVNRQPAVTYNVPFTRQAPFGEWNDPRQQDGCEEASIIMAMSWVRGGTAIDLEEARRDIINMAEYERVIFGFHQDTSIADTARLMREYYNYQNIEVKNNITANDIKNELAYRKLAIIPINTRLTQHPVYKYGPIRHTVVAVGYDDQTDEIIIHDPYLQNGSYLRLKSAALDRALWDYNSGIHLPSGPKRSALISVSR